MLLLSQFNVLLIALVCFLSVAFKWSLKNVFEDFKRQVVGVK